MNKCKTKANILPDDEEFLENLFQSYTSTDGLTHSDSDYFSGRDHSYSTPTSYYQYSDKCLTSSNSISDMNTPDRKPISNIDIPDFASSNPVQPLYVNTLEPKNHSSMSIILLTLK